MFAVVLVPLQLWEGRQAFSTSQQGIAHSLVPNQQNYAFVVQPERCCAAWGLAMGF